jgi:hypothetical protein
MIQSKLLLARRRGNVVIVDQLLNPSLKIAPPIYKQPKRLLYQALYVRSCFA